jgi:hypothetical protein
MVYFSSAPVAPESLDQEQFAALTQFKRWCESKGLIQQFENIVDFRQKFSRHLQIKLRDSPYLKELLEVLPKAEEAQPPTPDAPRFNLSNEGIMLLTAAAADRNGHIMNVRFLSGHVIQSDGKKFGDAQDRRSMARWELLNRMLPARD